MAEKRYALIIASWDYTADVGLRKLIAPPQDAESLAQVLQNPDIGGFEVRTLLNEPAPKVAEEIEAFFAERQRDDLVLLYFSGHGVKDADGQLYFAMPNTRRDRLRSTAIGAYEVNEMMRGSRAQQKVLLLDCCYSGAFARGMTFKSDQSIGTRDYFDGRGYAILTASDALQYSFEEEKVEGQGVQSVFTRILAQGLDKGEADTNGDGLITFDELYDFILDRIEQEAPQQKPRKWAMDVQGKIIIARSPLPILTPADLPHELQQTIEDSRPWVREGAVRELGRLLHGSHPGLAFAAEAALKRLTKDDSRLVSQAAAEALAAYAAQQREQAQAETQRLAREKAEAETLAAQKEKTQHLSWIGYAIGKRYKIEAPLGQGGMSTVYRGTDPNLQRTVAIKLIHPHLSSDPEFVRRFEQEAAVVAQLRHPNIIQVFDFAHEGDVYYMVLEYLAGETLQARLKTLQAAGQRQPLAETVRIMALICDAVAYAHQHGLIHRDLKPANVMLDPEGQPVLMDFGVAKMLGAQQHTATGAIVGTVVYMSPEQVRGERPDERADLYSLGIILYEMTTGHPPFEGDSAMTVMLKHLNEPVPDIRKITSGVPDELVAVIEKALAKDPAHRFQTATEMGVALRAIEETLQKRPAREQTEAERLAAQKAEEERLAREQAEQERLAHEKAEAERQAKAEANRLAAQKAEAERLAREKAEADRKAKAEADRLAAQKAEAERLAREKAEQERLAREKAEADHKAKAEADRLAAQKAEAERVARAKAEQERLARMKADADRLAAQKAEAERAARAKAEQEQRVRERAGEQPTTPAERQSVVTPTAHPTNLRMLWLVGVVVIVLIAVVGVGLLVVGRQFGQSTLPSAEGMANIPGGDYTVGVASGAQGENYAPQQQVTLTTFWIDKFEVTNALYRECVKAGRCTEAHIPDLPKQPGYRDDATYDKYPVIGVTWDQAKAYCRWANKRLPREAEWEVAARGTDGQLYPWGNDPVSLPGDGTYPVGSATENVSPFGVYDMAGNVWEWVDEPYVQVTAGDRVMRGGSYDFTRDMAYRLVGDPNVPSMYGTAGMRCAADAVKEKK